MRSGPNLPRVDAGLGNVPRPFCPGGLAMDSPSPHVCGRVYGATLAQSFVFCNGGGWHNLDGGVLLRPAPSFRGVWLGLRRHPARSALQRFWVRGDSLYPRRGLRPLHPARGRDGGLASQGGRDRGPPSESDHASHCPQFDLLTPLLVHRGASQFPWVGEEVCP